MNNCPNLTENAGFTPRRVFFVLLLLWAAFYLFRLGYLEVTFNETRRIFPALTMLDTGQWLTPVFGGHIYNQKPPLLNWLVALSVWLTGNADEFSCRIPVAMSLIPLLALLAFHRSAWIDLKGRFFAGLILLTSVGFLVKGRTCALDVCFAVSAGAAVLLWLDNWSLDQLGWRLWVPSGFALGIGLMLKGPLVLVVFYAVVTAVLWGSGNLKPILCSRWHWIGLALSLGIFLSWLLARSRWGIIDGGISDTGVTGGIDLKTTFSVWWVELTQRLFPAGQSHKSFHFGKWLRGMVGGPASFLPWLLFIPLLWRPKEIQPDRKGREGAIFIGLRRAMVILTLFIVAMPLTKARYLSPVFPLAALLLGWVLSRANLTALVRGWRRLITGVCWLPPILAMVGALAFYILKYHSNMLPAAVEALWTTELGRLIRLIDSQQMIFSALALFISFLIAMMIWRRRTQLNSISPLMASTVAIIFCVMSIITVFLFPLERSKEVLRPVSFCASGGMNSSDPIHVFNLGLVEPIRFYLPQNLQVMDPKNLPPVNDINRVLIYEGLGKGKKPLDSLPLSLRRLLETPDFRLLGQFRDKDEWYSVYDHKRGSG